MLCGSGQCHERIEFFFACLHCVYDGNIYGCPGLEMRALFSVLVGCSHHHFLCARASILAMVILSWCLSCPGTDPRLGETDFGFSPYDFHCT